MRRVDGSLAVDGRAKGVDDAAQHGVTDGDVHDVTRRGYLVALLDGIDVTEKDGANLVFLEVLSQAVHASARCGARELQQLAGHGALEACDVGNAVANLYDRGGLVGFHLRGNAVQLAPQGPHDAGGINVSNH